MLFHYQSMKKCLNVCRVEVKIYLSADQIDTNDLNERNNFPVAFLNSLTPSGMPPEMVVWMSHRLNGGFIHTRVLLGDTEEKAATKRL